MDKNATTPLRVAVISVFALSCFSLLLFLWLSFGGPIPLKPEGYRFKVSFPDATQLAEQADVRAAGVTIGKVVAKERDPQGNRTLAEVELEEKFAPVRSDARAILRQKTLLGETYIEMTTGSKGASMVKEGGRLADGQVAPTVEFDELLRTFDPDTREAFQLWQRELARASKGRGQDLNNAFGSLPQFVEAANDVLDVTNNRQTALRGLIRDTGITFEAITRDEDQLRSFISDTATVFDTMASQRENLAETFRIFPTFLDESKATFARRETFSRDTNPLLADLRPALEDLNPALADLRRLSPDLEAFFNDLPQLIEAGDEGMPALGRVLTGLDPVFKKVVPFLGEINPLLEYLRLNQDYLTDFVSIGGSAIATKPTGPSNGSNGHALPQLIVTGSQTPPTAKRTDDNRGNAYLGPNAPSNGSIKRNFILPTWDCANTTTGGPKPAGEEGDPACVLSGKIPFRGLEGKFPRVTRADYTGGASAARKGSGGAKTASAGG